LKKSTLFRTFPNLLFICVFLFGCAEVAPPPGGEIDKTGPKVLYTVPQNGAVNVPIDNKVSIYFSENIIKPEDDRTVFISPYQTIEPDVHWKSDRVEIIFADSFKQNQTYIISLSANLKDLRNNKIEDKMSIAFSTGTNIDSGTVNGHLYLNKEPKSGYLVSLFEQENFEEYDNYDSLRPLYIAQTNKDGLFDFSYITPNKYRLIAFDDKNQNDFFDPFKEPFAVTDRNIDLSQNINIDSLYLSITNQDTSLPKLLDVRLTNNHLLQVRLSKKIDMTFVKEKLSNLKMFVTGNPAEFYSPVSIMESDNEISNNLMFIFDSLPNNYYQFSFRYDDINIPLHKDSVLIEYVIDKTLPDISVFSPNPKPVFLSKLKMYAIFSEPIDTSLLTNSTFTLWQDSLTELQFNKRWTSPTYVEFDSPTITTGNNYLLKVIEFEVNDLSGNKLGDTIREYNFSILDDDSLGFVSGSVINLHPVAKEGTVRLLFINYATKQKFETDALNNTFLLKLPSGKYQLSGYIDKNKNSKRDLGQATPFELAEPFSVYNDTINIRQRFETSEIEFNIR